MNDYGLILTMVGALVAVTNCLTEVIKKVTWDKIPTQILATIIAEALTMSSGIAYMQINEIAIHWYMVAAVAVLGLLVAYAAMYGFEKLKEIAETVGGLNGRKR